jgi:hypothetical protein
MVMEQGRTEEGADVVPWVDVVWQGDSGAVQAGVTARLEAWLRLRLGRDDVRVVVR